MDKGMTRAGRGRRALSFVLAFAMTASLVPSAALAEAVDEAQDVTSVQSGAEGISDGLDAVGENEDVAILQTNEAAQEETEADRAIVKSDATTADGQDADGQDADKIADVQQNDEGEGAGLVRLGASLVAQLWSWDADKNEAVGTEALATSELEPVEGEQELMQGVAATFVRDVDDETTWRASVVFDPAEYSEEENVQLALAFDGEKVAVTKATLAYADEEPCDLEPRAWNEVSAVIDTTRGKATLTLDITTDADKIAAARDAQAESEDKADVSADAIAEKNTDDEQLIAENNAESERQAQQPDGAEGSEAKSDASIQVGDDADASLGFVTQGEPAQGEPAQNEPTQEELVVQDDTAQTTVTKTSISSYTLQFRAADSTDDTAWAASYTGTFTGAGVEPQVRLVSATDATDVVYQQGDEVSNFSISYTNNVNAGTAVAIVTGLNSYSGTSTGSFQIASASVASATVTANDLVCTGGAQVPVVSASLTGFDSFVAGTDYTVGYRKANTTDELATSVSAVGDYEAVITGCGNFTGTASCTFSVGTASIAEATAASQTKPYTGQAVAWDGAVTLAGNVLVAGTDYTVATDPANAVQAGTYTVTITGVGNYTGSTTTTLTIDEPAAGLSVVPVGTYTYTGSQQQILLAILKDGAAVDASDYTVSYAKNGTAIAATDIVDAGDYTATVTGPDDATASCTVTVQKAAYDLSGVTFASVTREYSPEGCTLTPTITDFNNLKASCAYHKIGADGTPATEATAAPIIELGSYEVTATFALKGDAAANYYLASATKTAVLTVVAAKVAFVEITDTSACTYTGSAQKPTVMAYTTDVSSMAAPVKYAYAINATDYALSYSNNVNAGTGIVTATGKGAYAGSAYATFTIAQADLADAKIGSVANVAYSETGMQLPSPSIIYGNTWLVVNRDYTLEYSTSEDFSTTIDELTAEGTYYVRAKAVDGGNYTGTSPVASFEVTSTVARVTKANGEATDGSYATLQAAIDAAEDGGTVALVLSLDNDAAESVTISDKSITLDLGKSYFRSAKDKPAITVAEGASLTLQASEGGRAIGNAYYSNGFVGYPVISNAGTTTVAMDEGTLTGNTVSTIVNTGTLYIQSGFVSYLDILGGTALENSGTAQITGGYFSSDDAKDYAVEGHTLVSTIIDRVTWYCLGRSLASARVTVDPSIATFDGTDKTPEVSLSYLGTKLVENEDYTLSWTKGQSTQAEQINAGELVDAGTYEVTATGAGTYGDTTTATLTILPANITAGKDAAATIGAIASQTYTGEAIEPELTVTDKHGNVLVEGTDYEVEFVNNVVGPTAVVQATGMGNYTGVATASFAIEAVPVAGVSVSPASLTLKVGETKTIRATVSPSDATDKSIDWISADPSIATVDSNGKVCAKKAGTTTVVAMAKDGSGLTASCKVTVTFDTVVSLSKSKLTVGKDCKANLTATVSTPTEDESVSWESSNSKVATVDAKGNVYGKKAGTATIAAVANDGTGARASCKVTVKVPTVRYALHAASASASTWGSWAKNGTATKGTKKTPSNGARVSLASSTLPYSGSIKYRVRLADGTWTSWATDGTAAGKLSSTARAKQIKIKLTGKMAKYYRVWYRIYDAKRGWLGWNANGSTAGRASESGTICKVQIKLISRRAIGENTMRTWPVRRTAKASTLKKKSVTVGRPFKVTRARGALSYTKVSGSDRLAVDASTGKVTVKKGTKKGTYKVRIRVSAAGNAKHKKISKVVTCRVVVK